MDVSVHMLYIYSYTDWNKACNLSITYRYRKYKDYVYGRCSYKSTWKNIEYLRSKDKAQKWYDVSRHIIAFVKIQKKKIY